MSDFSLKLRIKIDACVILLSRRFSDQFPRGAFIRGLAPRASLMMGPQEPGVHPGRGTGWGGGGSVVIAELGGDASLLAACLAGMPT